MHQPDPLSAGVALPSLQEDAPQTEKKWTKKKNPAGVIFDFDGTICNQHSVAETVGSILTGYNGQSHKHIDTDEEARIVAAIEALSPGAPTHHKFGKLKDPEILKALLSDYDVNDRKLFAKLARKADTMPSAEIACIDPEAVKLMEKLKENETPIGILTMSDRGRMQAIIDKLDPALASVIHLHTIEDFDPPKPDERPAKNAHEVSKLLKKMHINAGPRVWMIGDHYNDMEAGFRAGLRILLRTSMLEDNEKKEIVIPWDSENRPNLTRLRIPCFQSIGQISGLIGLEPQNVRTR